MSKRRILICGARGMLAQDVLSVFEEANFSFITSDLNGEGLDCALNICDLEACSKVLQEYRPEWILNLAAYTAVDQAEVEPQLAFEVNARGVSNLALAAGQNNCAVAHISSDYVFGHAGLPQVGEVIAEDMQHSPCGIYGLSKSYGDQLLSGILPDSHLIIRTSWLHGKHGANFVDTMLRLGKERDELSIVSDQYGSPTWTGWLAIVIRSLIEKNSRGVFHSSSRGGITWFDFAKEIFLQAGLNVSLSKQSTQELGRPAERPAYSVMDVSKLEKHLGRSCWDWRDCVKGHLESL